MRTETNWTKILYLTWTKMSWTNERRRMTIPNSKSWSGNLSWKRSFRKTRWRSLMNWRSLPKTPTKTNWKTLSWRSLRSLKNSRSWRSLRNENWKYWKMNLIRWNSKKSDWNSPMKRTRSCEKNSRNWKNWKQANSQSFLSWNWTKRSESWTPKNWNLRTVRKMSWKKTPKSLKKIPNSKS